VGGYYYINVGQKILPNAFTTQRKKGGELKNLSWAPSRNTEQNPNPKKRKKTGEVLWLWQPGGGRQKSEHKKGDGVEVLFPKARSSQTC